MMKSAESQAKDFLTLVGPALAENRPDLLHTLTLAFKEHARDQRHLCAESIPFKLPDTQFQALAHSIVMNTPAPGMNN